MSRRRRASSHATSNASASSEAASATSVGSGSRHGNAARPSASIGPARSPAPVDHDAVASRGRTRLGHDDLGLRCADAFEAEGLTGRDPGRGGLESRPRAGPHAGCSFDRETAVMR